MSEKAFIAVHVTPRSGRDEVVGVKVGSDGGGHAGGTARTGGSRSDSDGGGATEVQVRVTAPPDGGKANKAVCKLVAAALGIPKSAVEVASGQTSRHKRLSAACSAERVNAWKGSLPVL